MGASIAQRLTRCWLAGFLAAAGGTAAAQAPAHPAGVMVDYSALTGHAMFVRPAAPPLAGLQQPQAVAPATADEVLDRYGHLFGVADPQRQLQREGAATDELGYQHITYRQMHHGVPVFSGMLKVHLDPQGQFSA
ncbi:MAG: hypothetical protein M3Z21_14560, partial [Pseudomonadota bacterium]|nr:hypothetical protein [Pseudomonadota bacterium]